MTEAEPKADRRPTTTSSYRRLNHRATGRSSIGPSPTPPAGNGDGACGRDRDGEVRRRIHDSESRGVRRSPGICQIDGLALLGSFLDREGIATRCLNRRPAQTSAIRVLLVEALDLIFGQGAMEQRQLVDGALEWVQSVRIGSRSDSEWVMAAPQRPAGVGGFLPTIQIELHAPGASPGLRDYDVVPIVVIFTCRAHQVTGPVHQVLQTHAPIAAAAHPRYIVITPGPKESSYLVGQARYTLGLAVTETTQRPRYRRNPRGVTTCTGR